MNVLQSALLVARLFEPHSRQETWPQNDKFKILCGGSEWYRKGLDVVLKVFLKMNLPDAELHIKIVPPYLSAPDNLNYLNVVVHNQWMTVEDEADLVRS